MHYNIFRLLYCIRYFDIGIFARNNQLPTLHVIVKEYPTMQCIILEFSGIPCQRECIRFSPSISGSKMHRVGTVFAFPILKSHTFIIRDSPNPVLLYLDCVSTSY